MSQNVAVCPGDDEPASPMLTRLPFGYLRSCISSFRMTASQQSTPQLFSSFPNFQWFQVAMYVSKTSRETSLTNNVEKDKNTPAVVSLAAGGVAGGVEGFLSVPK